jgi:hypothetical protein
MIIPGRIWVAGIAMSKTFLLEKAGLDWYVLPAASGKQRNRQQRLPVRKGRKDRIEILPQSQPRPHLAGLAFRSGSCEPGPARVRPVADALLSSRKVETTLRGASLSKYLSVEGELCEVSELMEGEDHE